MPRKEKRRQPSKGDDEEWQARDEGKVSGLWHNYVSDWCRLIHASTPTLFKIKEIDKNPTP